MAVNLSKNQTVSLTKESLLQLNKVVCGTSWKGIPSLVTKSANFLGKLFGGKEGATTTFYESVDVDSFVFLLDGTDTVFDTVSFSRLKDSSGAVVHAGDDRTGKNKQGDTDNEEITIDLTILPLAITRVVFAVNVFTSNYRFHEIDGLYSRIVNANGREELARYELGKDFKGNVCVITGEMYRSGNEWVYKAIGIGTNHGSISSLRSDLKQYIN